MRFYIFLIPLIAFSCTNKDASVELPKKPIITFVSFEYVEDNEIQLRFKYQDGDANLGFENNNSFVDPWVYPKDEHDQFILIGSSDTLPEYNCYDWKIGADIEDQEGFDIYGLSPDDTVLSEPNPHFYNFHIEFYRIQNNVEIPIDFTSACYPGYDARLYDFNEKSKTENFEYFPNDKYSGEVLCKFPGGGWSIIADGKPIKAYFSVFDNDFYKSNIEQTTNLLIE